MNHLLIAGSNGQLGRALAAVAERRGIACAGRDMDTLDITDPTAVARWIDEEQPNVVVNAAAFTAVDACETQEDEATAVNGTAVAHLAEACNRVDAQLVHVSTDYVFAGDAARPYREDDPVDPRSAYGRSKLIGERAACTARRHLVARTAWLYGLGGRNFVEAICRQVDSGAETLRVVHDQVGCPTFCDDLAGALLDLAHHGATGTVHVVNSGTTSWHGFATEIVRLLGARVQVQPVATGEYALPAPRPAYSVLDTSRLAEFTGAPLPTWQDALSRYMAAR